MRRSEYVRERHNMKRFPRLDSDWGIAAVRMIMGFMLILTGYEKLTSGIQRVSASMVKNQIPFPTVMAAYITALELLGGFLLLIGLGGRWLGLLYICLLYTSPSPRDS